MKFSEKTGSLLRMRLAHVTSDYVSKTQGPYLLAPSSLLPVSPLQEFNVGNNMFATGFAGFTHLASTSDPHPRYCCCSAVLVLCEQ